MLAGVAGLLSVQARFLSADESRVHRPSTELSGIISLLQQYQEDVYTITKAQGIFDFSKLDDPKEMEDLRVELSKRPCILSDSFKCERLLDAAIEQEARKLRARTFSRFDDPVLLRRLQRHLVEIETKVAEQDRPAILIGTLPSGCSEAFHVTLKEKLTDSTRLLVFDFGLDAFIRRVAELTAYMIERDSKAELPQVDTPIQYKSPEQLLADERYVFDQVFGTVPALIKHANTFAVPVALNASQRHIANVLRDAMWRFVVAHEYAHALLRHPSTEAEVLKIATSSVALKTFLGGIEKEADARAALLLVEHYGGRLSRKDLRVVAIVAYFAFRELFDRAAVNGKGRSMVEISPDYSDHPPPWERIDNVLALLVPREHAPWLLPDANINVLWSDNSDDVLMRRGYREKKEGVDLVRQVARSLWGIIASLTIQNDALKGYYVCH